jgi:ATP-binding cassette subfamily B protein
VDVRKYRIEDYAKIFSVVFQDFQLLALPLGENVAASSDVDSKRAVNALEKTGFSIKSLPKVLDSHLFKQYDDEGGALSGGESQKAALARAIYKDAPFVVLDEPTAALDPLAEHAIYTKFDSIVGGKTAVYISHRLSSCRFCSDIAVFHEGRLIQRGSHDELVMQREGKYFELWNAQAQHCI